MKRSKCVDCGALTDYRNVRCRPCHVADRRVTPQTMSRGSLEDRFHDQVDRREPQVCWPWTGRVDSKGYGVIEVGSRGASHAYKAHRLALLFAGEDVTSDLFVLHSCDNPICVNPSHLRVGTNAENMQDMYARGRRPYRRKPGPPVPLGLLP